MNLDYLKLVSLDNYVPYYTLNLWEKYKPLYSTSNGFFNNIFEKTSKFGFAFSKRELVLQIERKKNEER